MINTTNLSKAYKEVLEILKFVQEEDYNIIPKETIQIMLNNMDREYEFKITSYEDFKTKQLLYETELILAIFFRDYWATEEQKEKIKLYEEYELKRIEEKIYSMELNEQKKINMAILNVFFINKYDYEKDFYAQFYERINTVKKELK